MPSFKSKQIFVPEIRVQMRVVGIGGELIKIDVTMVIIIQAQIGVYFTN